MPIQSDNPPQILTISEWKGLNQQSKRGSIDDNEVWWDENLFAIGPGNLRACFGPSAPIYTAPAGTTILRLFCGFYGNLTPPYGSPPPGAMGWLFLSDGSIDEIQLFPPNEFSPLRAQTLAAGGAWTPIAPQYWASAKVWRPQFQGAVVGQPGGVLFGSPKGLYAWDGTTLYKPGDNAPDWLTDLSETHPGSGPGSGPPTSWNPSDKTSSTTLSNNNLTARFTGANQGVRAIDSLSAGTFYFEETMTSLTGIGSVGVGTATTDLTQVADPTANVAVVLSNGQINVGSTNTGFSIGALSNGDIVAIAVDLTAQLIWFKVSPSGSWNGNSAANPETNTGGISIASLGVPLFPVTGSETSNAAFTANFGATAFAGTVPNGFTSGWLSSPAPPTPPPMPTGLPGIYAMEVFQSRLWVAGKDVISFSAPSNGADFSTTDGGGSFGYFGDKLVYSYMDLHSVGGYMFVFGDSSTDLISQVTLTGQGTPESPFTTNFSYENVDPQVGHRFPRPVGVLGRYMVLFNMAGFFLMQGGDAQPIGDKVTGIWNTLDTSQYLPTFSPACMHGFRVMLVNGRFTDIFGVTRSMLLMWHPTKGHEFWSIASQGVELTNIACYEQDSCEYPFGTDGTSLYQLFCRPDPALIKRLVTKTVRGQGISQITTKNWKRVYLEVDDNDGRGVQVTGTVECGDGGVPGGTQGVSFELSPGERHKLIPQPIEGFGIYAGVDLTTYSPDFTYERLHLAAEERTLFGA